MIESTNATLITSVTDFDEWVSLGAEGWSYNDLNPFVLVSCGHLRLTTLNPSLHPPQLLPKGREVPSELRASQSESDQSWEVRASRDGLPFRDCSECHYTIHCLFGPNTRVHLAD